MTYSEINVKLGAIFSNQKKFRYSASDRTSVEKHWCTYYFCFNASMIKISLAGKLFTLGEFDSF